MQESPAQIATTTAETTTPLPKQRRGFAVMDPDTLRVVCVLARRTDRPRARPSTPLQHREGIASRKEGRSDGERRSLPHGRDRQPRRQSQEGLPREASRTMPSRGRDDPDRLTPI
jgi:hypothetical protein